MPVLIDYSIRVASAADAPHLATLCQAHAAFERLDNSAEGHAQRLSEALTSQRIKAWMAWDAEQPVGYASLTLDFATLSARTFAHLDCLYLAPEARGKGLGQALMQAAQDFARSNGCLQMQWQTPDWNAPATRFYERLGAKAALKQRFSLKL